MKKLHDRVYDTPGTCPVCGAALRPVSLLRAEISYSQGQSTESYEGGRWVTKTPEYTHYDNLTPVVLGFCEACDKARWDAQEEAEAKKPKPSPVKMIASLALFALGVFLTAMYQKVPFDAGLTLAAGIIMILFGFVLSVSKIGNYVLDLKKWKKNADGFREPYRPAEDETVARLASDWENHIAYLTPLAAEKMRWDEKNRILGIK